MISYNRGPPRARGPPAVHDDPYKLERKNIMSANENFCEFIRRYKKEHGMSISEMAEEFGIAKSAVVSYLNGACNPRSDTIDLLAEKCGVSAAEMISAQSPGWERAEIIERAARLFSSVPPERRDRAVKLFLALVDELSEEYHS